MTKDLLQKNHTVRIKKDSKGNNVPLTELIEAIKDLKLTKQVLKYLGSK